MYDLFVSERHASDGTFGHAGPEEFLSLEALLLDNNDGLCNMHEIQYGYWVTTDMTEIIPNLC